MLAARVGPVGSIQRLVNQAVNSDLSPFGQFFTVVAQQYDPRFRDFFEQTSDMYETVTVRLPAWRIPEHVLDVIPHSMGADGTVVLEYKAEKRQAPAEQRFIVGKQFVTGITQLVVSGTLVDWVGIPLPKPYMGELRPILQQVVSQQMPIVYKWNAIEEFSRKGRLSLDDFGEVYVSETTLNQIFDLLQRISYVYEKVVSNETEKSFQYPGDKEKAKILLGKIYEKLVLGILETNEIKTYAVKNDFMALAAILSRATDIGISIEEADELLLGSGRASELVQTNKLDPSIKYEKLLGVWKDAVVKLVQHSTGFGGSMVLKEAYLPIDKRAESRETEIDREARILDDLIRRSGVSVPEIVKHYSGKALLLKKVDGANLQEAGPQNALFFRKLEVLLHEIAMSGYSIADLSAGNFMVRKDGDPVLVNVADLKEMPKEMDVEKHERYDRELEIVFKRLEENRLQPPENVSGAGDSSIAQGYLPEDLASKKGEIKAKDSTLRDNRAIAIETEYSDVLTDEEGVSYKIVLFDAEIEDHKKFILNWADHDENIVYLSRESVSDAIRAGPEKVRELIWHEVHCDESEWGHYFTIIAQQNNPLFNDNYAQGNFQEISIEVPARIVSKRLLPLISYERVEGKKGYIRISYKAMVDKNSGAVINDAAMGLPRPFKGALQPVLRETVRNNLLLNNPLLERFFQRRSNTAARDRFQASHVLTCNKPGEVAAVFAEVDRMSDAEKIAAADRLLDEYHNQYPAISGPVSKLLWRETYGQDDFHQALFSAGYNFLISPNNLNDFVNNFLTPGSLFYEDRTGMLFTLKLSYLLIHAVEIMSRRDLVALGELYSDDISTEQIDEDTAVLRKGSKELPVTRYRAGGKEYVEIGNRVYEKQPGIPVNLSEIMSDPLLWLGNVMLLDFFGEDSIIVSLEGKRAPPSCSIVEWTSELAESIPLKNPRLSGSRIAEAFQKARNPLTNPFMKTHYRLACYFDKVMDLQTGQGGENISPEFLEMMAQLSDEKLNEIIFSLLGAKNCIIPDVLSSQFRRFYQMLSRLAAIENIIMLNSFSEQALSENGSDIVVGRLGSMMSQITDEEVQNFNSLEELNELLERKTGKTLDISIEETEEGNILQFKLDELAEEKRSRPQRIMNVFPARGPPSAINKDETVVGALAHLARTGSAWLVNSVVHFSYGWNKRWAVSKVFQGASANNQVQPAVGVVGGKERFKNLLSDKKIGVIRGGFGLGGASIETETWIRDVFTKDNMFGDGVEVLAGNYDENVYFGDRANENRSRNYFVDGYFYKKLANAVFSEEPLSDKDMADVVFKMDSVIRGMQESADVTDPIVGKVAGVDSFDAIKQRQTEFFEKRGLSGVLREARSGNPLSEIQRIDLLQAVHDFCVEETKNAIVHWILEKNLDVVMIGQVALPVENPVVYAGIVRALEEVNKIRSSETKAICYVRQNYFRQPRTKPRINIYMPTPNDPVEIFVESETNADIFEELFSFRPSVLYEAVKIFDMDFFDNRSIQDQMRAPGERTLSRIDSEEKAAYEDFNGAMESFREILETKSREQGKDPVILDGDPEKRDIIILQPSRMDANKRPDSTLRLAKDLQDIEDNKAAEAGRISRRVRVLFLGQYLGTAEDAGEAKDVSGNERETYQRMVRMARELGIEDQVYFLGSIKQREVLAGMTFSHVMSQPSDRETFGRTPMEAMSMGVPVVVSRNYLYPFFEEHQVFRKLFGGFRIFTLPHGEMKGGEWVPGRQEASSGMVQRIWEIVSDSENMKSISELNYQLLRRSMMNIRNLENFMKIWSLFQLDPESNSVRFIDAVVSGTRAGDLIRPLEIACRRNNVPDDIFNKIMTARSFAEGLKGVDGKYLRAFLRAVQEVSGTSVDSDRILERMLLELYRIIPVEKRASELLQRLESADKAIPSLASGIVQRSDPQTIASLFKQIQTRINLQAILYNYDIVRELEVINEEMIKAIGNINGISSNEKREVSPWSYPKSNVAAKQRAEDMLVDQIISNPDKAVEKLYVITGVPGAGKSTFAKNLGERISAAIGISTNPEVSRLKVRVIDRDDFQEDRFMTHMGKGTPEPYDPDTIYIVEGYGSTEEIANVYETAVINGKDYLKNTVESIGYFVPYSEARRRLEGRKRQGDDILLGDYENFFDEWYFGEDFSRYNMVVNGGAPFTPGTNIVQGFSDEDL
ncbi:MAG: glycosyltransferase, partial [Candidatus Theseobacter exili]|nr:glycosyltransferase [Candidatus Theseobacter exili]